MIKLVTVLENQTRLRRGPDWVRTESNPLWFIHCPEKVNSYSRRAHSRKTARHSQIRVQTGARESQTVLERRWFLGQGSERFKDKVWTFYEQTHRVYRQGLDRVIKGLSYLSTFIWEFLLRYWQFAWFVLIQSPDLFNAGQCEFVFCPGNPG